MTKLLSTTLLRRALMAALVVFSLLGLWVSHLKLTMGALEFDRHDNFMLVPQARWVKPLCLGHEAFLADLIWIRTLGYFADQVMARGRLPYLEALLQLATDLDPRFEKIYIWAGAALMYNTGVIHRQDIEASNRLLKRGWDYIQNDPVGWRHDPEYWRIPQMIGFNYAVELRDRDNAVPYVTAAARIPGIPSQFKTWAAYIVRRAVGQESSVRLLENVLAIEMLNAHLGQLESEGARHLVRQRLQGYYAQLYGAQAASDKIGRLESRFSDLIGTWSQSFYFIPFNLYLLLEPSALETNVETGHDGALDVGSMLFPYLGY